MTSSLVGSEMCIRDRDIVRRCWGRILAAFSSITWMCASGLCAWRRWAIRGMDQKCLESLPH
eukprot:12436527-Prorocentrum_lima.AAC.1